MGIGEREQRRQESSDDERVAGGSRGRGEWREAREHDRSNASYPRREWFLLGGYRVRQEHVQQQRRALWDVCQLAWSVFIAQASSVASPG